MEIEGWVGFAITGRGMEPEFAMGVDMHNELVTDIMTSVHVGTKHGVQSLTGVGHLETTSHLPSTTTPHEGRLQWGAAKLEH